MTRIVSLVATAVVPVAIGIAAIVYGEADDAPGLVMLGLLFIVGGVAFAAKPALRSTPRFLGFIGAAIALTVVGSLVAGWLENTF